jgi:hypothetical protein
MNLLEIGHESVEWIHEHSGAVKGAEFLAV